MEILNFQETFNLLTRKSTYYIDGKRVSRDLFNLRSMLCDRMECLHAVEKGNYRRYFRTGRM